MKLKKKLLDLTLTSLLFSGAAFAAPVESDNAGEPFVADTSLDVDGKKASKTPVAQPVGRYSIDLPNGGLVWAVEDPNLTMPALSVQAAEMVPLEDGRIAKPVQFHGYSNYPSFIKRLEVKVYRGRDTDLVTPLATFDMPVGATTDYTWDGELPASLNLKPGDELIYVTRAYGADGAFDETLSQRLQMVTPADYERGLRGVRDDMQRRLGQALGDDHAQSLAIEHDIYGQSGLRLQNIPVYGSRVRLNGRGLETNSQLTINGQRVLVDRERKFVAEFLEPVGEHRYEVTFESPDAKPLTQELDVKVTGRYTFLVAMADMTLSKNSVSGSVEPVAGDYQYDSGFLGEGRLAFYMKKKVQGKYLITAQADTRQNPLDHTFTDFLKADPRDVFRRLDPDDYYPVYSDDSATYRDVDTQGRFYLRMDWDQNQALWGNYNTGITGTEYGQYNRSLYGAALSWRSRETTALGAPSSEVKAFGSQAQSAPGHSEFLGTGGSLYYLRHTDVLRGSDKLVLEVRDHTTGRVEARVELAQGADYEIDELQGRVILTRPLSQISRENVRTLTRDAPLDGYDQVLLADYEYVPAGFDPAHASTGFRGKHWFGNHVGVGGTYVDESRNGEDYTLKAADLTLQAGRGTYLKLEQSHSESTAAPIFYSDNGGLSFFERNNVEGARSGNARALEARVNFKELGWTQQDWSAGAWWREVGSGFSTSHFDDARGIHEYGAEVLGDVTERFNIYSRYSRAERGTEALEQAQITTDWRLTDDIQIGSELRRVQEIRDIGNTNELLGALSYSQRVTSNLDVYTIGQLTLDDGGDRYEKNNLLTVGSKYQFGDLSSVGAEVSSGNRGYGAQVNGEYRLTPEHTFYSAYNFTTDATPRDSLFNRKLQTGWTLGQRWRLSSQVNLYNETQFLKDKSDGSSGLSNSVGTDFYPGGGWTLGLALMEATLDTPNGRVNRHAYSVSSGQTDENLQWTSKLEYREDRGAEHRRQWVNTNRVTYKVNEDWRVAARVNYADTKDLINVAAGAKLVDSNIGFAWRPHDTTQWAIFGKYTYLYDQASLGQVDGLTKYDQRSHVLSFEGITQLSPRWELGGKLSSRWGEYRMGRGTGLWLDSRADFAAAQLRYRLTGKWEALAEHRALKVREGGIRTGWLVGLDRQLGENFKLGVGYNFTNFSDDLTNLRYDNKGWFLNMTGYY